MIVVTGANGKLGRAVVEELLERLPVERIAVNVRDLVKATALVGRGVQVRAGDFIDPESLAAAFEGAAQVLVISVDRLGEEGRQQHRRAIRAARRAGTRRVLYTSHMDTHAGSPFSDHSAAEAGAARRRRDHPRRGVARVAGAGHHPGARPDRGVPAAL